MGTEAVLVSVVVPMFNARATVERALNSVLCQGVPVDMIFVDDCSEDGTADFVEQLSGIYATDIRLIRSDRNVGVSAARNLGLAAVTTPYVAFLDADDVWLPDKLTEQLPLMARRSEVSLTTCDSFCVAPDGRIISRSHENHRPAEGPDAWKELLAHNFIPTPTVLTRTEIVRSIGGFDPKLSIGEDLDLWISIAKCGEVAVVRKVLVHYFNYSDSLMKTTGRRDETLILEMVERHLSDPRLNDGEKRALLARRYFEMGRGFARHNSEHMRRYMEMAVENGLDREVVNAYLRRRRLKSSLRTARSLLTR